MELVDVPDDEIRTASDRQAIADGCRWAPEAIRHVERFAATLRDPMDPSKPFRLLSWQAEVARPLFGWRRTDGRRRFNRLDLWIPKKNGKTGFLAFLSLVFLLADGEARPGVFSIAAIAEQAGELVRDAVAMTKGTAWDQVLDVQEYRNRIRSWPNAGEFRALAASAEGVEGVRGSMVCIDEAHAGLSKNPRLYAALRYAGSGRTQPLFAVISTAGDDRQKLPFRLYTRTKSILSGETIDTRTLARIWEAADQDEYTAEELTAVNPAVGEILDAEQLQADYDEARLSSVDFENFKRYRLNVWTKRATAWLDASAWADCCRSDFELDAIAGLPAYVGVDLSSRLDLTAAVAVVPLPDGRFLFLPQFWLPGVGIDKRSVHEMDYRDAARQGHIELVPGETIDYAEVEGWIAGLEDACGVRPEQIAFDPWRAKELAARLEDRGFDCVQVKQGWQLSEPCLRFESLIATREAVHLGNSVLSWCIGNVERRTDQNGKMRPVKPTGPRRIDGVVAAVEGLYLAMFAEPDGGWLFG